MPGRPKTPMYEYTPDGKFIQEYDSLTEVHKKYYAGQKVPLFSNKFYKTLPNGNIILKTRVYRDTLRKIVRAVNSKYTTHEKLKPVGMYNLFDERIATFRSSYMANLVTGIPTSTINNQLKPNKRREKAPRSTEFLFKYEK